MTDLAPRTPTPAGDGEMARLTDPGLFTDEGLGTTCCFATSDEVGVTAPDGQHCEVCTVLADSPTFGSPRSHLLLKEIQMFPDLSGAVAAEHARALREDACRQRLAALARCCRPSQLRRLLDVLRPAAPCCA